MNVSQERKLSTTMKLTFQKTALLNGINIVLKAVPSKTTMPILECILIDASTDEIKLTANDMELGIETKVEGDILEKGKIALDAKLFSEIARKTFGFLRIFSGKGKTPEENFLGGLVMPSNQQN